MSQPYVGAEALQSSPRIEITSEGILDDSEEDGIDLDGYEEYLERLKSKAAIRPCSARVVRPMPTESPQFFMSNADNSVPTRPVRPVSARPRMRSTPRSSLDDRTLNGSQSRSSGVGVRRKRQGEKLAHARIRAVYNDVRRIPLPMKQTVAPCSATSALYSRSRELQEAEKHDEYYRLLDAESELKAACLQEQQKRVKAVAHVRRLEEIITMKDKKIESLLHAKAVGSDRSLSTNRSVAQREMAERERQSHALAQKLRQKIAQQSQLLSSYEEAMQSLRSGIKSTNLMELEEERCQLYQELRHYQELLDRQRFEWEAHQQKLATFAEAEASSKLQIAKLQQENKLVAHEKRKLEQEIGVLKSQVELLQSNLTLEQRKRTYDRDFSEGVGKQAASSPAQKVMLAQALQEMKNLMQRETIASTKREKLKSPKTGTFPPRPDSFTSPSTNKPATTVHVQSTIPTTFSAPKTPSRSAGASLSQPRAHSATITRPHGAVARQAASFSPNTHSASGNRDCSTKVDSISAGIAGTLLVATGSTLQDQGKQESRHFDLQDAGLDAKNEGLPIIPVIPGERTPKIHDAQRIDTAPNDKKIDWVGAIAIQDAHETENHEPSENERTSATAEANSGSGPQSGAPCTPATADHDSGQITDEQISEMQQQNLDAIASVLRLDIDDDSELSADMLDDAQHLRSNPEMIIDSVDDVDDAALISFVVPKEATRDLNEEASSPLPLVACVVEDAALDESQDEGAQLSQTLDDLYEPDFLDTDA